MLFRMVPSIRGLGGNLDAVFQVVSSKMGNLKDTDNFPVLLGLDARHDDHTMCPRAIVYPASSSSSMYADARVLTEPLASSLDSLRTLEQLRQEVMELKAKNLRLRGVVADMRREMERLRDPDPGVGEAWKDGRERQLLSEIQQLR